MVRSCQTHGDFKGKRCPLCKADAVRQKKKVKADKQIRALGELFDGQRGVEW